MKKISIKIASMALMFVTNLCAQSGVTNLDFEATTSSSVTNMCNFTGGGTVMPTGFSGQVSSSNGPVNPSGYTLSPIAQSGSNYVTVSGYIGTCGNIDLGNYVGKLNPSSAGWGAPYTSKPTSFCGYYRTQGLVANDSCFAIVYLSKNGVNIGYGKYVITSNQSNWTNFCASISYSSSASPDTIKIRFTPIKGYSGLNSNYSPNNIIMDIDNCSLSSSATAISDTENLLNAVVISPNPNNGEFEISLDNTQTYDYFIYDAFGKSVLIGHSEGGEKVSVTMLTKGIYILKLKYNNYETNRRIVVTN